MSHYPKIAGDKCYLSPISTEDAEVWAQWLNDIDVALPLGDETYTEITFEKVQEEIREASRRQDPLFTIVERKTDRPIGRCLLFRVDHTNRSAMLGIFIGEKSCWGQGYGLEASRLLLDYGFNLLNLHSVMLGVFAFNERAIRVYRRLGFHEIGRRREARLVGGKHYDVILMDLLEDEFRAQYPDSRVVKI